MPLEEAVSRLRGAPGSSVTVWVVREGNKSWTKPKRLDLVRAGIHIGEQCARNSIATSHIIDKGSDTRMVQVAMAVAMIAQHEPGVHPFPQQRDTRIVHDAGILELVFIHKPDRRCVVRAQRAYDSRRHIALECDITANDGAYGKIVEGNRNEPLC